LCEKPLATTAAEAWRVVETEVALGQRLVTVGFMRRFDPPHTAVKAAVQSGRIGRAYLYKGSHRNQAIPPDFPQSYVISQSAIHDLDAARWLLDQDIKEVYAQGVHVDPAIEANTMDLVLLTMSMMDGALASIEVFLSAQYGYEVTAEVVGERGVLTTLQLDPILVRFDHTRSVAVPSDWLERFAEAYVIEVRQWVNVLRLAQQVGATAWDGYAALLVSDACLASLDSGQPEAVVGPPKPELYL
jgi:myo-inositol 2-dehydrogenase/D-chiro-inositol 1-dehydrogenase